MCVCIHLGGGELFSFYVDGVVFAYLVFYKQTGYGTFPPQHSRALLYFNLKKFPRGNLRQDESHAVPADGTVES